MYESDLSSEKKGVTMDASFWHRKWEKGDIGFYEKDTNVLLKRYLSKLNLNQGNRIFLPLCGKTRDIAWLLANGYNIAGAELSEIAVKDLFHDLGIVPEIFSIGSLIHYKAKGIDVFVGDIFEVNSELLGLVDAVYDRAALVALPLRMRELYTSHLLKITNGAPQLLITYEYDQQLIEGPPFSISKEEVNNHYANEYTITNLERKEISGGLKGKVSSSETVWLLQGNM